MEIKLLNIILDIQIFQILIGREYFHLEQRTRLPERVGRFVPGSAGHLNRPAAEWHRSELAASENPKIARAAFAGLSEDMVQDLNELFEFGIDEQLNDAIGLLTSLRKKLNRYCSADDLTPAETEERDLLFAWIQILDPDLTKLKGLDLDAL